MNEIIERIARIVPEDGHVEPLKGLIFYRLSSPTAIVHGMSDLALCVIAQGTKEILLGEDRYRYDPAHYLLTTLEMPVVSQVIEASRAQPYLSVRIKLDPALVSSVMVETGQLAAAHNRKVKAIDVSPIDDGLLDAVLRLVRLLDSPVDAGFLAPVVSKEIVYRLLKGEQGNRLCHMATFGGHTHHIAQAIEQLRADFNKSLRIEDLANRFGMSVSGFHHHFKTITNMSPLQFQKRLRLQEARRLIVGDGLDAASAGYGVGYEDAAHFSREYKKFFGLPPIRDAERLRSGVGG